MKEKIIEALRKLDVANDSHWTADGLPRLDKMEELLGENVSRADVNGALTGFKKGEDIDALVKSEEPPVETKAGDSVVSEDAGEAEEALEEARVALVDARAEQDEANTKVAEATEEFNKAHAKLISSKGNADLASNVKSFQAQQFEERRRKVNAQKGLVEALKSLSK